MSSLIFNWVDVIGIVLLMRCGYMGLTMGFGEELTKLLSFLLGICVAFRWSNIAMAWITGHTPVDATWAAALALGAMVIVTYVVVVTMLRMIQQAVSFQFASTFGQIAGAVVGVVRGALLFSFVVVMLQKLPSDYLKSSVGPEQSLTASRAADLVPMFYTTLGSRIMPPSEAETHPDSAHRRRSRP